MHFYFQIVQKEIIVIIGGPGTGKSTLINQLTSLGHCCYPEISRQVTAEAQKSGIDQLFLTEPLLFSQKLLEGRIQQFNNAKNENHAMVFIDRGIPDVVAYLNYIGDQYPSHFEEACLKHTYTQIFMLPPWEEIYISDNERYEDYEQAQQIHVHLKETYQKYGYAIIEVPKDTVDNRIQFILDRISTP